MRARRGKNLLVAGGVVVLIAIAAIVAIFSFDINKFKSNIESAAFDATGLGVRINGTIGLSLSPLGVSAKDIHVAGKVGEIFSAKKLKLGLEFMPLLKKEIAITGCQLVNPAFNIVKDTEGKYNFENIKRKQTKWKLNTAAGLKKLRLSNGALVYLDKKTGDRSELKDFNLAIKNLSTGNTPVVDIIKSASLTGSVDFKEFLQKDLRIVNLKAAVKAAKGRYTFQPLTIASLVYFDRKGGENTELKEINLALKDLSLANTSGEITKNVSFHGNIACREVRKKNLRIDNVKSSIVAGKAVYHLKPLVMSVFGARGEGDATADKSRGDAVYKINLKVPGLDFEKLQKSLGTKRVIGGKGDLLASLTMKKKGSRKLLSSMDGSLSLRGDNLVIYTMDLDKVLSKYERSQEFNLIDLGAFLIAGPLGTVAFRGYGYGDLYNQTRGGQGVITHFISHWKIKGGVADATDCAFATRHNRIALKGKLDLVTERYENVTVALLDDRGCAKFKQSISGPFGRPRVGRVSAIESLAGPIVNLYRRSKRFIQGGKCEVFYNGTVRQPR